MDRLFYLPCLLALPAHSLPALDALAFPAQPAAAREHVIWVPPGARRFGGVCRLKRLAPQKVLSARNWFKMCRINARAYTAKMIQLKAGRDRAYQSLVGVPMGHDRVPADRQMPVALRVPRACPKPTFARLANSSPKGGLCVAARLIFPPSQVMHVAHSAGLSGAHTVGSRALGGHGTMILPQVDNG